MRAAAEAAGFEEIREVSEPLAAAWAWVEIAKDDLNTKVIVLDCGGGTVDWAYVKRESGDRDFQISHEFVKPGAIEIGGVNVDERLHDFVKPQLKGKKYASFHLKKEARTWKEEYCKKEDDCPEYEVTEFEGNPI